MGHAGDKAWLRRVSSALPVSSQESQRGRVCQRVWWTVGPEHCYWGWQGEGGSWSLPLVASPVTGEEREERRKVIIQVKLRGFRGISFGAGATDH